MAQKNTSYRPHPKWHDYKARGIYMITLVVQNRDHILGELNMDAKNPGVILSETGKLTALCDATKRELREGHNLEKMYISGEFDKYE